MGAWQKWQDSQPPSAGIIESAIFFVIWQLIKLPFLAVAAPFKFAMKNAEERRARDEALQQERKRQTEEAETQALIDYHERQRAEAYAALPVVDRMTANLKVEGRNVYLQVALSEEERGIIAQNQLGDIVIEEAPLFTEEEIENLVAKQEQDYAEFINSSVIDFKFDRAKIAAQYRKSRNRTALADYLDPFFMRTFDVPHQAVEYAKKLEKIILPKIIAIIDEHRTTANSSKTIRL